MNKVWYDFRRERRRNIIAVPAGQPRHWLGSSAKKQMCIASASVFITRAVFSAGRHYRVQWALSITYRSKLIHGWYCSQPFARWTRIWLELQTRVKSVKKLQTRRTRESRGYVERFR